MAAVKTMQPHHVKVAAEAFAAAVLAQANCDVLVQYGADQPEFDLVAARGPHVIKVSVKGSQDGGWGLIQSYKKGRSYHEAIDHWRGRHDPKTVLCFVQFQGTALGECPRIYLARVGEVAEVLKAARKGHGDTTLMERHEYKAGLGAGSVNQAPSSWRLSAKRVAAFFTDAP